MKLPDFSKFEPLNLLRNGMGAQLTSFKMTMYRKLTGKEETELKGSGYEITSDDENFTVHPDKTLTYKNHRVLVYIRDLPAYGYSERGQDHFPKFHMSDCSTLQRMREMKRSARFVMSIRNDGLFAVRHIGKRHGQYREELVPLHVCKNCLNNLGFNGYSYSSSQASRSEVFDAFNLDDFFSQYPLTPITIKPIHTSVTAPVNTYSEGFGKILSPRIKKEKKWICQEQGCGIDLSAHKLKRYLDTHHKNGEKSDNRHSNLEVLCIRCHSNRPLHGHLKQGIRYREFIDMLRRRSTTL